MDGHSSAFFLLNWRNVEKMTYVNLCKLKPSVSHSHYFPFPLSSAKVTNDASASIDGIRKSGMILEVGITFTVAHYVHIFQSLARGQFGPMQGPCMVMYRAINDP